uniref:Uncharacterized protein n=1 Tax=mine drainage metagenome TaxID=410659 RepID=E6QR43_9ZZZZ
MTTSPHHKSFDTAVYVDDNDSHMCFYAGFGTACQDRSIRGHEPAFCGNLVDPQNVHDIRKFIWVGDEGPDWLRDGIIWLSVQSGLR